MFLSLIRSSNHLAIVLFVVLLISCVKDEPSEPQSLEQAYINGAIYTVNPDQVWAEAMFVQEGVITAIGTTDEIQTLVTESTDVIDLQNQMVMPGIHDVHLHPLEAASENFQFILDGTEPDPENYSWDIEDALFDNPNSEWILGWGFDIYTLFDSEREPIQILDDLSTSRPIVVLEQTSHAAWVNSRALELMGWDENTINPDGGIIMKDENGIPNGILLDNAGNQVVDLAISTIPNNEDKDYEGLIFYALPELAKNGITSICDARTYWKRNHHLTWKRVSEEGRLTVRANLGLWLYPTADDETQMNTIKSLYSFDPDSFLKINQIKLYSDGIVINTTSAMLQEYLIDLYGKKPNNGLNYVTEQRIGKYISELEQFGFDFHIHALGDRGVRESLNAIEQNGTSTGRHRLTHIEYVSPEDYPRFSALNVTADAQVAGDFTKPERWHDTDELIGSDLNENVIPIKSLNQANARITLSSDWDVSTLNPFVGLQNAVERVPQELSLAEAIKAYTLNAAYVMRQENVVGSLEVGKEADFIVLNQNLFEIKTSSIGKTEVQRTYLKGNLVFKK